MECKDLVSIIDKFKHCNIAILGDIMLDMFCWGKVERISPEAPVPIVHVNEETFKMGGAANVANNIAAMGGNAYIFGIIGDDGNGRKMLELLTKSGIETDGIIADSGRQTSIKIRVLGRNQQMLRIDKEDIQPIDYERQKIFLERLIKMSDKLDGIIISDYAKGMVSKDLLDEIVKKFRKAGKFINIDPKVKNFEIYQKATLITPNASEAAAALGLERFSSEEELLKGGDTLRKQHSLDMLLITRSEKGMSLFRKSAPPITIPTEAINVYDVTGAGDTVISTFSLAMAANATPEQAAEISNLAAGVVVGKVGTAFATTDEILAHFDKRSLKKPSSGSQ